MAAWSTISNITAPLLSKLAAVASIPPDTEWPIQDLNLHRPTGSAREALRSAGCSPIAVNSLSDTYDKAVVQIGSHFQALYASTLQQLVTSFDDSMQGFERLEGALTSRFLIDYNAAADKVQEAMLIEVEAWQEIRLDSTKIVELKGSFTPEVTAMLESVFTRKMKLSTAEKISLSSATGLSNRQVAVWFANQRQRRVRRVPGSAVLPVNSVGPTRSLIRSAPVQRKKFDSAVPSSDARSSLRPKTTSTAHCGPTASTTPRGSQALFDSENNPILDNSTKAGNSFNISEMYTADVDSGCKRRVAEQAPAEIFTGPIFFQDYTATAQASSSKLGCLTDANDPTLFLLACDPSPSGTQSAHSFDFAASFLSQTSLQTVAFPASPARLDYESFLAGLEGPLQPDDTFWAQILDHSAQAEAANFSTLVL